MTSSEQKPTSRLAQLLNETFDGELLLADGFDDAFLGFAERCGQPAVAVYDAEKCIEILMRDGMDAETAREYFDFNVVGAWVGPQTPVFLEKLEGWNRGVDDWTKPPV